MQQHSGQHILSQAFLLTSRLNTAGFHMGADYATIDLGGENLTPEQIRQAEDLANRIVCENRPVQTRVVPAETVSTLGLRKETSREGPVRIVEIDRFDLSACGGTHVRSTGEIGAIVIRKLERVNRQTRVEFLCGKRVVESYRSVIQTLDQTARKFSIGWTELPLRVDRLQDDLKQLRKEVQDKSKGLAAFQARDLYAAAPALPQGFRLIRRTFQGETLEFLKTLAFKLIAEGPCLVLFGNEAQEAQIVLAQHAALSCDLRQLIGECCRVIEGKGGGAKTLVQGGGPNRGRLQEALDWAEAQVLAPPDRGESCGL
jgi:alanyl-tRNA synthetase